YTVLENYTMSSAASAAAMVSSAGLVSAIPALAMITGQSLPAWKLMLWITAISMLGVFMAVPLKRQLINVEKLPFPSGIAAAATLRSLHTSGGEAMRKARLLFTFLAVGGVVGIWKHLGDLGGLLMRWQPLQSLGTIFQNGALPDKIPLLNTA